MTYEILEKRIKTIPQDYIQEILDYIDFICYKKNKKDDSVQDKNFAAVNAMFGTISPETAQELRESKVNFGERI